MHQASRNVGCGEETNAGGLGGQNKEAGGKIICCSKMVERRGCRSEMHGEVYSISLRCSVAYAAQNITAFLMGQHKQFQDVMEALRIAKDQLDPARQVPYRPWYSQEYEQSAGCVTMISLRRSMSSQLVPTYVYRHVSRYTRKTVKQVTILISSTEVHHSTNPIN